MLPLKNLVLLLFTFFYSALYAQEIYKIEPYSQKIELDGQDKEAVWSQLPFSENFVAIKGNERPKFTTRFKLFSNKEFLFVLIEAQGQNLADIKKAKSEFSKEKGGFPSDQFVLYLAPRAEIDDCYKIFIDYQDHLEDCYYPPKVGAGFPFSSQIDWEWDSKTKYAINSKDNLITIELKIAIEPLALQKNLFDHFGFNIQRKVIYQDGKNNKTEDSCWSHVNGELWNTEKFGLVQGPLYTGPQNFTEDDLKNLDQMTNGMAALFKSLDIYYKAVIRYKGHIPEGTEVSGDIRNFSHVPLPQYPVKADGYFRFFNATQYQPYKDLGNQIINKLFKSYSETKDGRGKSFLLWNNQISKDGKVYGYDQGPKINIFGDANVPFDQSGAPFHLKGIVYQEALGQGFLDLSEIKDTLDTDIQDKLKQIIIGTLDFLHQPNVLIERGDEYFWRIDAFSPSNPLPFKGELKKEDWSFLGMDIVLMFMALENLDTESGKVYIESFVKFSKFYINSRLRLSNQKGPHDPFHIHQLDHRMLSLAKFTKEKGLKEFEFLDKWLMSELPKIYAEIPKVDYSDNGATANSWSTQSMFEIYRLLGLKAPFLSFWKASFDKNMTPLGISQGHRILPMNFSSYPIYFDYAKNAFDAGIFNESQLSNVFKKMFLIYGNPALHRTQLKYSLDLLPIQKSRPFWGNTPFEHYIDGVLPEGIYANGSAQAFYSIFANFSTNDIFKPNEGHFRYRYQYKYYQYTAPFQFHADRFSYGKAESFTLIKMPWSPVKKEMLTNDQNAPSVTLEAILPDLPVGLPVFGHLDISEVMFNEESAQKPTGLKVDEVLCNGKSIPFKDYQVLFFDGILFNKDKAKLVFGLWNISPRQKAIIEVRFKKKQFKQYFESIENQ